MKHQIISLNGGKIVKNKNRDDRFLQIEKEEKMSKYGKNHVRNKVLVNLITGVRSLGALAIVPVYYLGGAMAAGLAAIGFFATDFIDGFLARKLHVESFFGCLLDALSDKAFGIVCLLLLGTFNPVLLLPLLLEGAITYVNYTSLDKGNNVHSSIAGKIKTFLLAGTIVGSFFCYAAPSVKEVLNYIHVYSLDKLLELDPKLLTTILALPTIGMSAYVCHDYKKRAMEQTATKEVQKNEELEKTNNEEVAVGELTIPQIEDMRAELLRQKEKISQDKEKVRKSKDEIIHDLFDTDFYLEHRNDDIKKLLFK